MSKHESHVFETSRDLAVRCPSASWIEAQEFPMETPCQLDGQYTLKGGDSAKLATNVIILYTNSSVILIYAGWHNDRKQFNTINGIHEQVIQHYVITSTKYMSCLTTNKLMHNKNTNLQAGNMSSQHKPDMANPPANWMQRHTKKVVVSKMINERSIRTSGVSIHVHERGFHILFFISIWS